MAIKNKLKNKDFNRIFQKQHCFHTKTICLVYEKNNSSHLQWGIAVNKKFWNAVKRNKIKRIVRSIVHDQLPDNLGFNFILSVKRNFLKYNYKDNQIFVMQALNFLKRQARLKSKVSRQSTYDSRITPK